MTTAQSFGGELLPFKIIKKNQSEDVDVILTSAINDFNDFDMLL